MSALELLSLTDLLSASSSVQFKGGTGDLLKYYCTIIADK